MKIKLTDMNRSGDEAEWHSVPPNDWGPAQRFADEHGEWATPANLVTVIGAAATGAGLAMMCSNDPSTNLKGLAAIGFGRLMDIADGKIASWTGTKTPIGEKLDAGVDTALMVGALGVLMLSGILPESQGWATAAVTATKMGFTAIAGYKGNEIHVTRAGKLSVFGLWGGLGAFAYSHIEEKYGHLIASHDYHTIGNIILGASIALSAKAAWDYKNYAFPSKKIPTKS